MQTLLELRRTEGEPLDQFSVKFQLKLILFKYLPPENQLTSWFKYLISLPCNSNKESHTKEDTNKVIYDNENIELGSSSSSKTLIDSQSSNEYVFQSKKDNNSNTSPHSHNDFNDYKSTPISQSYNDNVPS